MPKLIDGLLEGHEEPAPKAAYRIFMFSYINLSVFSGVCNFGTVGNSNSLSLYLVLSVAILGLLVLSLVQVFWYSSGELHPKIRKGTIALIALVVLLDTASCMAFHRTLSYHEPSSVMAPYSTPPPTPTNITGTNTTRPPVLKRSKLAHTAVPTVRSSGLRILE